MGATCCFSIPGRPWRRRGGAALKSKGASGALAPLAAKSPKNLTFSKRSWAKLYEDTTEDARTTSTSVRRQAEEVDERVCGILFVVQSRLAKDGKVEPRPGSVLYKDDVQQKISVICQSAGDWQSDTNVMFGSRWVIA